jgi:hypothetical protein
MNPFDRRRFLDLIRRATAAGLVSSLSVDGLVRRAEAQTSSGIPMGRRFVHINFSNGGLGWMFTCICPPSYLNATNKGSLALWSPSLALEDVTTPSGGRFVIPRPILDAFDAQGDRAAFERVLDGCVAFLGCGTGAPIHQTYAPSFQLTLGARTTDVSSEVARQQQLVTPYPMINMGGASLFGTGPRSFLAVSGNDVARLFERVTDAPGFDDAQINHVASLLNALNPDEHKGPYARTLATQLVATRESSRLLVPDPSVLTRLQVATGVAYQNGTPLPAAMQPLAVRMGRLDRVGALTQGGTNTYFIGSMEVGALGQETTRIVRGAAGIIQAMENGIGAENVQIDGVMDDPHNRIAELHAVGNTNDLYEAMLIKLWWVFAFLVELEKRGLFAETTVLVDGDFSRVLNVQYDDGGVNGLILFSGTGRLRPGFYGDSGVRGDGACWYRLPDLYAAARDMTAPGLQPEQLDGGSDLPHKLCLGIALLAMGMSPAEAGLAADMREDEVALIQVFSRA